MLYKHSLACIAACILSFGHGAVIDSQRVRSLAEKEVDVLESRGSMLSMDTLRQWPGGIIPYVLEGYPSDLGDTLRADMRRWESQSCIRFVQKTTEDTWVNFQRYDQGCFTKGVGAPPSGELLVNLDYPKAWEKMLSLFKNKGCGTAGVPASQLGHVIGLVSEVQRPDRDDYVKVLSNRIDSRASALFDIIPNANTSIPFDYGSVMMYDSKAFAKSSFIKNMLGVVLGDGVLKHTLETTTDVEINPSTAPSVPDFMTVNMQYQCPEYYTRALPECLSGPIPADTDFSSYSFIVDSLTEDYMKANDYQFIGVHQHCNSNAPRMDTDNWAFTPLNGSGPDAQYKVTVDRCKKEHDRHASDYEIAMCRGLNGETCDIKCGYRNVCPMNPETNEGQKSKAVDILDNALWVCHPH